MYRNKYSSGVAAWGVGLAVLGTIGLVATANNSIEKTEFITVTESIPYSTTYVEDATLDYGKSVTRTAGLSGLRTLTYKVKKKGGKETSRELTKSEITREPRDAVTTIASIAMGQADMCQIQRRECLIRTMYQGKRGQHTTIIFKKFFGLTAEKVGGYNKDIGYLKRRLYGRGVLASETRKSKYQHIEYR